jgi:formylglycine-generating enzyme required for sulfatase activity
VPTPAAAQPWTQAGAQTGQEITGPDGGKMVWVPAGEFMMGTNEGGDNFKDARPAHQVRITKGFWLGRCTVTHAQYRQYCQETGANFPEGNYQGGNYPMVAVSWDQAQAYCQYYGLSLPTEAQWEYAARGAEDRQYPWGNQWDPKKCNHSSNQGPDGHLMPVGSFPAGASWCGALDMAGNVWQWCQDWYGAKYYANSPEDDPPGPITGTMRVRRGGSWVSDSDNCRSALRDYLDPPNPGSGFRCSMTP